MKPNKDFLRKRSNQSMSNILNGLNLKRKSIREYNSMKKVDVLKALKGFLSNLDKSRYKIVEMELQNNFLIRKIELLEDQISYYKENGNFKTGRNKKA